MKTKPKTAPTTPDLADLIARARKLTDDYRTWEAAQPGDHDRFYSLRSMILPSILVVVGQSEEEIVTAAMYALEVAAA